MGIISIITTTIITRTRTRTSIVTVTPTSIRRWSR
jgi:hypothetical protein